MEASDHIGTWPAVVKKLWHRNFLGKLVRRNLMEIRCLSSLSVRHNMTSMICILVSKLTIHLGLPKVTAKCISLVIDHWHYWWQNFSPDVQHSHLTTCNRWFNISDGQRKILLTIASNVFPKLGNSEVKKFQMNHPRSQIVRCIVSHWLGNQTCVRGKWSKRTRGNGVSERNSAEIELDTGEQVTTWETKWRT